jgi:hypothetical protein
MPGASEAANGPGGENTGLFTRPIGSVAVNRLVHYSIAARTHPLCQPSVRCVGASGYAGSFDRESPAVDTADRSFGAGRKEQKS